MARILKGSKTKEGEGGGRSKQAERDSAKGCGSQLRENGRLDNLSMDFQGGIAHQGFCRARAVISKEAWVHGWGFETENVGRRK